MSIKKAGKIPAYLSLPQFSFTKLKTLIFLLSRLPFLSFFSVTCSHYKCFLFDLPLLFILLFIPFFIFIFIFGITWIWRRDSNATGSVFRQLEIDFKFLSCGRWSLLLGI